MKIMKFGGTSVGKPERMHQVYELITKDTESKIVVLSALSGTTNALVDISNSLSAGNKTEAKQKIDTLEAHYHAFVLDLLKTEALIAKGNAIVKEHFEFLNIITKISFSDALNKDILAQGELMSTKLFCCYLEQQGQDHLLLPALDFMVLDQNEEPNLPLIRSKLTALLAAHTDKKIFITQGYICKNVRGEVDNLKRGGSDYTASLVAAACNASVCEIWTDIDGMHNNDPRVVDRTRPIAELSFDEAAELAYFGAKILHPASIWPAQLHNVPVRLLNTMDPAAAGTLIKAEVAETGVKAIAAKDGITAINIKSSRMLLAYGFLRRIFEVFESFKTPIDMITTSEVAVSVTIDDLSHLDQIVEELRRFGTVEVDSNQAIVCVVGNQVAETKGAIQSVMDSLVDIPVRMVSFGGSKHNVSILIDAQYKVQALKNLNEGVFTW